MEEVEEHVDEGVGGEIIAGDNEEVVALEMELSCAALKRKRDRRMMIKPRGSTAAFQIEVRRWQGVVRKERTSKECQSGEVEDVCHWLLTVPSLGPSHATLGGRRQPV